MQSSGTFNKKILNGLSLLVNQQLLLKANYLRFQLIQIVVILISQKSTLLQCLMNDDNWYYKLITDYNTEYYIFEFKSS